MSNYIPKNMQATSPTAWSSGAPPYAGYSPGTIEWMEIWKANPTLQDEMLQYQAVLTMGIDPIESPNPEKPKNSVFRISNSAIESSSRCSTQALLRYGYNVVPEKEVFPLAVGSAIHKALAHKYRTGNIKESWQLFTDSYPQGTSPIDNYNQDNCFTVFKYFLESIQMPYIVHPQLVELWFERKLFEDNKSVIMICGRLDLIVQDKSTKAFYVLDHKSTKKITDWWLRKFRMSSQLTGYVWAAQGFMDSIIPGAIVDAIEIPILPGSADPSRKCPKHSTPYSECRKFHPNHQQFVCERPPWMIESWKLDTIFQAKRLRDLIADYNSSPDGVKYVRQQGTQNGGCVFCDYVDFCLADRPVDWIGQEGKLPYVKSNYVE